MKILLFCVISLCTLLSGPVPALAADTADTQVILFIHSYHPTYLWTSDITAGFLEDLGDPGPGKRIAIEYLDWKNYPSEHTLDLQEELMRYKYGSLPVILVVTADDAALQFVLDRRDTLFPTVPVVFTGLNGYETLHPYTYQNVTGIVTAINPEATLQAMIALFPETTDIWIVNENTETGREISRAIHEAAARIPTDITYHDIGNLTEEEVYRRVAELPPGSLILIGNWSRDAAGKVADISRFAEYLAANSPVPVFNLYDFNSGKGTIGGSILSARYQGVLAARMTKEVLAGRPAGDIPVNLNGSTEYVFDARVVNRFGVGDRLLPGSILINEEPGILEVYFREVITAVIIIILLSLSLIALLYQMHQRRKIAHLLELFINTLPGFVFFKDRAGQYRIMNQRLLDMVGLDRNGLIGKTDADIFPPDLAQAYRESDMQVITTNTPLFIPEEDVEVRPGMRLVHATRKVPVTGDRDEVIGVIGLSVDISEQKAARQAAEESREKYYSLFELGWEAILLVENNTGQILEANRAASDFYGYSHEELLCMTMPGLSGEPEKTREIFTDDTSESFFIPIQNHTRRDGSIFPVEILGRYFEWNGRRVHVAAIRDISERMRDMEALRKATGKINLFNYLTRTTLNNQLFILRGYLGLALDNSMEEETKRFIGMGGGALDAIERLMLFMKHYQDLGMKPAVWINVGEVFLYAISHVDLTGISRTLEVDDLFIYADPFLEKVFEHLVENSIAHGGTVTVISLRYERQDGDLLLWYEDNGTGIPDTLKKDIFSLNIEEKSGVGLILVREILGITGIAVSEEGVYGSGARFLIRIPKDGFRFGSGDPPDDGSETRIT